MEFTFLTTYYGLDWISSLLGLAGLYYVSEKHKCGFLLTAVSVVLATIVSLIAEQYGFLVANAATFVLAVRGYMQWQRDAASFDASPTKASTS